MSCVFYLRRSDQAEGAFRPSRGGEWGRIQVDFLTMKDAAVKVRPDEFILAALSPEERLNAALRVAREAFKGTQLTVADVEAAVRKVRRKRHAAQGTKATGRR